MNPDRLTRMESLIEQALGLAPEEREIFLRQECGNDQALRNELESLLENSEVAFHVIQDLADNLVTPSLSDLGSHEPSIPNPDEQDLSGTTVAHYRIINEVGMGGMGVVYKAFDSRLERTVALKCLPPGMKLTNKNTSRFIREAQTAAAINHPNICHIHSISEQFGRHFIDMEYIEGDTLRELIEVGSLNFQQSVDIAKQILKALSAAHDKGIIHRDIKPENIMVNRDHVVKVMDFGLAKLKGSPNLTKKGATIGTVAYMSPEQIRGAELDLRSDLFSFGITLYEMITESHPFRTDLEQSTCFRILNEQPEFPGTILDEIPANVDDILKRCLAKEPDQRYNTAGEILNELERTINPGDEPESEDQTLLSANRPLNKNGSGRFKKPVKKSSFLAMLILIVAGLTLYLSHKGLILHENIPSEKHIVVLPFNNLSQETIPASLSSGFTELLTSKITQLDVQQGSLWVVPSSEVHYQQVSSVAEAARLFGTNLAVTGSLKRDDNQVQITINLVNSSTIRQIRSRILKTEWSDFDRLQDQIIDTLIEILEIDYPDERYQTITAGNSDHSTAYRLYIEGLGTLSRYEEPEYLEASISMLEEAVQTDTTFARAYSKLAEAYWRKFDFTGDTQWTQRAIKNSDRAIALNDRIPEVHITKALIYNGMGRYDEALAILDLLAEKHPLNYSALVEQARAYNAKGMTEKAEETFLHAIEQKSTFWHAYNSLGVFYYEHGHLDKAAESFRKVTELTPDNNRAFNNLGGVYLAMENEEDAIKAFQRSLELQENHRALTNLGTYYYYQREYNEAIRYYEKAKELVDTDYRIWGNLGFSYHWSDQDTSKIRFTLNRAIRLAEKAREIRPNDARLLSQLAGYYAILGDQDNSKRILIQLTSLDVLEPETKANIAHLYEQLGERETAIHWIRESLDQGYRLHTIESLEGMQDLLKDPRMTALKEQYEPD